MGMEPGLEDPGLELRVCSSGGMWREGCSWDGGSRAKKQPVTLLDTSLPCTNSHQPLSAPLLPLPHCCWCFPESPGSKPGLGKPDAISSVRRQVPPRQFGRGDGTILSPLSAPGKPWSTQTRRFPALKSSSRDVSSQRIYFRTCPTPGVPSGCSSPCRRALAMPARCGCCPGRGPRRSPRGGSCGSAAVCAHPAPPEPAHLRGDTHSISGMRPKPKPKPQSRVSEGAEEGALPIPAPKVAAASGLNGFDYLIRLWFNGLDNM